MDISDKTKQIVDSKAYLLELEKRLVNIESSVQNLSASIQRGSLLPEQEGRVAVLEDRLENVEDLQMVANLDLIKLKEDAEKVPAGTYASMPEKSDSSMEKRVGDIEALLRKLEGAGTNVGGASGNGADIQAVRKDIDNLRTDFASFKNETEEVIKVVISSIKRLSEVMK